MRQRRGGGPRVPTRKDPGGADRRGVPRGEEECRPRSDAGYRVNPATDGQEALGIAARNPCYATPASRQAGRCSGRGVVLPHTEQTTEQTEAPVTDPRDLSQATDDELRAADAAAEVRTPRGHDGGTPTPVRPATGAPAGDPRDLDESTDDELRAAEAAASVRVERRGG